MTVSVGEARIAVSTFYGMLGAGDAEGVVDVVNSCFADDVVLSRPESLPGGGTIDGVAKVAKFMRAATGVAKGLQLRQLHVVASNDEVEVHAFAVVDLNVGAPTSAIEWWVFCPSGVASLTAYYWDTAALLAG